jgi:O-Antigen ligase
MGYTDCIIMSRVKNKALGVPIAIGVAIILVLVPFHAFLTVWAASAVGHYTWLRLWKEFLLLPLAAMAAWLVWLDQNLRREAGKSWLLRLMLAYVGLQFLLGAVAYGRHAVNFAALAEGLIEDTRLMVVFFVAWAAAARSGWLRTHWRPLLLIPAAIVVGFGLLQALVLPANFLSHFGYTQATIPAYELIDQNGSFVRVQSSLRGANPLGAYLVVVIAAIVGLGAESRVKGQGSRKKRPRASVIPAPKPESSQKGNSYFTGSPIRLRMTLAVFGAATLAVLYFTYSRSAYLGAMLAVFGVGWVSITKSKVKAWSLAAMVVLVLMFGGLALLLRHTGGFENTFFHTSQASHSPHSSNQNHVAALENGLRDVARQPLGRGPGTAGPASVHNRHPARIAENYFLQIGQESGWLGLALFIAINFLLAKELWLRRRAADRLPIILLASLAGLTLINLLSHAWADDTLAYLWWGLAGITLAPIIQTKAEQAGVKHERTGQAN